MGRPGDRSSRIVAGRDLGAGPVTLKNRWLARGHPVLGGGPHREVALNAGGGDAFLLAGQQGQSSRTAATSAACTGA